MSCDVQEGRLWSLTSFLVGPDFLLRAILHPASSSFSFGSIFVAFFIPVLPFRSRFSALLYFHLYFAPASSRFVVCHLYSAIYINSAIYIDGLIWGYSSI